MAQPALHDTDILFLNLDMGKTLTGIEHSALARASLFIDELGVHPLIVTFQYRPELQRNVAALLGSERYHSATRIKGLYDCLQGFDDPALPVRELKGTLPPATDPSFIGYTPAPVEGHKDVRYLNGQGRLFAYKVYSKEHGELIHINYFEKGQKVAADIYHTTGHRSSHRLYDPNSRQRTHEIFYSPWGTPLFFRVFEREGTESSPEERLAPGFYLHASLTTGQSFSQPTHASFESTATGLRAIDHILGQCTFLGDSTDFSLYALNALTTRLKSERLWLLNDKNKFTFKASALLRDTPVGANREKQIRVFGALHSTHFQGKELDTKLKTHYRDLLEGHDAPNGVVALTQVQTRDVERRFPDQNVVTVPHTLSASYKALKSADGEGPPSQRDKIVYVARLSPEKQHLKALEILAEVVKHAPQVCLHLYGEGGERDKIKARIEALGLERHVVLEGYCNDIASIYRDAQCAILTSVMEGFPLTLLEAMAFRCPVVAFDVRYGPSDMIVSDETGFLVAPNDTTAFAEHLTRLVVEPGLARRLGDHARARFKTHFSPSSVAKRWEETIMESFR
ncbi:glycosyltransferase [Halomonas sp. PAMB 3232]|uniref:glycosyltransferase n=1 Tax=Halomonas sp. PAMB 3232 TaxID=3075221 RepID=UPI00289C5FFD|nr:glycosyltransferase [Halomonas sp. PAMB 3232]WNL38395.1 glycosyltransferase [Halomonas sp. PAMB 3232]